jgi:hypothetical protein
MRIFVSYAKEDRPHIESIAARLRQLGHEPWYDQELRSGPWWDQILAGIRGCELFIATISPAALSSRACLLERRYAADLQRTQLLLMIVPVPHHLLPGDLAPLQIVDYTARDEAAAFRLFGELNTLRPSPPPPSPLPDAPRPPLSHLNRVRDRITGLPMGAREQLEVVDELAQTVRSRDPEEVAAARELLVLLGARTDNFEATAHRIRGVLGQLGPGPQPAWGPPPAPQPPPAQGPSRRIVTVLAWIGGVVVVLVVLAVLTSGSDSTPTPRPGSEPCFDLSTGQQVDPIFCQ